MAPWYIAVNERGAFLNLHSGAVLSDTLHIDFETRSVVDLKKFGLAVYAKHPLTDAWCMAWAFNDEPVEIWRRGQELPSRIAAHVKAGGLVIGHNITFEHYIWNSVMRPKHNWPLLKLSQLDCTMARAFAMALPGSLKNLSQALGVAAHKDQGGYALMLKMSKPRSYNGDGSPVWWEDADKFDRLCRYCIQDVVVERECDEQMVLLSPEERALWMLDQKINARGIMVDMPAIEKTKVLIARTMKRMDKQMKLASGGAMSKVSEAKKTLEWCQGQGINIENLKKNEIKDWLENEDLPYEVREVLEIRSKSAKISVTKLETMERWGVADGRLYGQFQYHGATTGRFSGRGVQLHNLPRPEPEFPLWGEPAFQDRLLNDITRGDIDDEFIEEWYGPFMRVISSCVRAYLIAPNGRELIGADLKNIEGVVLAWLAGEEWKLEAFRENFFNGGPGIYELTAGRILGKDFSDVTKAERQVWGKVSELSLGYQGGKGAYKSMAVNYGVKIEDDKAEEIKLGWREAHPAIKNYWYAVEKAAIKALRDPGGLYSAGAKGREISFKFAGECLWLRLPSGRVLSYPHPELRAVPTPWGEQKMLPTFMSTDSRVGSKTKGRFVRLSSYGGKFVENITQAVARDVLTEGMLRVEKAGYPIVLHVHDEAVSEIQHGYGTVTQYEELMATNPTWAKDLPLAAEGFRGKRYRK